MRVKCQGLKKYLEKKQGKKEDKEEVKEGSAYGITKGDGMSFPERLKEGKEKEREDVGRKERTSYYKDVSRAVI